MEKRWEKLSSLDRIAWILYGFNLAVIGVWILVFYRGGSTTIPIISTFIPGRISELLWFLSVLVALLSPWILLMLSELKKFKIERRDKKK